MSTTRVGGPTTGGLRERPLFAAGAAARRGGRGVGLAVAASAAAVALVTAGIGVLKLVVPVLSLGVLYVFAVLPVAAAFGVGYAIGVSLASMVAFNFFFLPPVHTLTLADSANWLALAVYVCTSVVVGELATRQRRRANEAEQREREAALLAGIAVGLLAHGEVADELDNIGRVAGAVLGAHDARIALGPVPPDARADQTALPLMAGERLVATLTIPAEVTVDVSVRERFLPAVASLLALAADRERLGREVAEAEVLRRSDAVKTVVLRAVSHDLRSPLTAIRVASDSLVEGSLGLSDTDRVELVETVRAESRRLERTVCNLLDLSKLQAGAARPNPELWTADALVERALAELGERGACIKVELPRELPVILADAGHVRRALVNLFENALGVSPVGASVRVRGAATPDAVELRITDEGPGVTTQDADAIFGPFRRGAGVTHDGAGLGLAIVRGFADANGGRTWVESPAAGGACFVLALPRFSAETP